MPGADWDCGFISLCSIPAQQLPIKIYNYKILILDRKTYSTGGWSSPSPDSVLRFFRSQWSCFTTPRPFASVAITTSTCWPTTTKSPLSKIGAAHPRLRDGPWSWSKTPTTSSASGAALTSTSPLPTNPSSWA